MLGSRQRGLWLPGGQFNLCDSQIIAGKIAGGYLLVREHWLMKSAIGMAMVPRGEVALVIASIGLGYPKFFDSSEFTATVLLVIVSSLVTPILIGRGFGKPSQEGQHVH